MKILDTIRILEEVCKATGKWGMFFNIVHTKDRNGVVELTEDRKVKAAPYLNLDDHFQVIADGSGFILFDTEEEMHKAYDLTVGDDGPTEANPYKGKDRVYVLTCDNKGQLLTENT